MFRTHEERILGLRMPGARPGIAQSETAFNSDFPSRAHASDSKHNERTEAISTKKDTTTGDAGNREQTSMGFEHPPRNKHWDHVVSSIFESPSSSNLGVLI